MKSLAIISFPIGGQRWQIHSLGAIRRNVGDTNNQTIEVFLTCLDSLSKLDVQFAASAPIGLLPILTIGSVWRNKWHERGEPTHLGRKLRIKLDPGTGSIVQAAAHPDFFPRCWRLPLDIAKRGYFVQAAGKYGLRGQRGNCTVLFPCPVIFAQFYGGTSNLATLLCRYPPPGKSWERIYYLKTQQTEEGTEIRSFYDQAKSRVHVCLGTCIEDAGYRHVAWFFYEKQARSEAEAIPKRLSTAPGDLWIGSHLSIKLPFTSGTELDCYGVWDEQTRTVLVHRVTWCGYQMTGVRTVTFDRENDSRPVQDVPPGACYEERPADGSPPPRKEAATTPPEGGQVTLDPPLGDQQSLTWQVADAMELPGFVGGKVTKLHLRTSNPTPTPPLTDDEVHELLGCGEKAYTAEAKPGLVVQPPNPQSADAVLKSEELLSQVQEKGFLFVLEVLRSLLAKGWQVDYAVDRHRLIFDLSPTRDPGETRRLPQGRALVVKLLHSSSRFILIEFALRSGQSTATVIIWPKESAQASSPRGLLNIILTRGGSWIRIKPALEEEGWKAVAVKHQNIHADETQLYAPANQNDDFIANVQHHADKLLKHFSN